MRGSFSIGRIAGIQIGIHYSWLFAFVLFAWLFAQGTFPAIFPTWSTTADWIGGVVVSLAIFVSVLIHELCHSLVAISRGMQVTSIVFFIFGGVSNIAKEPDRAWEEFIMAGAGPASSVVLGAVFIGIAYGIAQVNGHVATPLYGVLFYIGWINVLLAAFNLIPGFPLDGGRVFRSIIWGATRSLHTATLVAGNVGRFFGWAMILFGIANFFPGLQIGSVFQGSFLNGIWFIFIGWFLTSAADSAMREEAMTRQLAGVKVKDVMDVHPECVSPNATVEMIVHQAFIQRGRKALPVCTDAGLLGIVTLPDVKKVPQDQWGSTLVKDVMTQTPLQSVDEDDDLSKALNTLGQNELNQIPVMGAGKLVGLLSRADVIRFLQARHELGIKPKS